MSISQWICDLHHGKTHVVHFAQDAMIKIIRDLEVPIVYTMTGVACFVSLFVYGATLIRSEGGGLLGFLRPVFGVAYGLIFLAVLVALLANSRKWKGIGLVGVAYLLMLMLSFSPTRTHPVALSEYLVLSITIALLMISACLHYGVLDPE